MDLFHVSCSQQKLQAIGAASRIGGKGTPRRKSKGRGKAVSSVEKNLQPVLKKLGCNTVPQVDEVSMYNESGTVTVFMNPKVQVAVQRNTFVVTGKPEEKKIQDMIPNILESLSAEQKKMLTQELSNPAASEEAPSLVAGGAAN